MPTRHQANQKGGQNPKSNPSKSKHKPKDKTKHKPKDKPKEQNTTKRETGLRCFNDPHLKFQTRHYLLDLHHYCENMSRAHSTPAMFSKLSHYAEDTLYRGDVKHLGAWSKISYLHLEALRDASVVKEVEVDDWKQTVHTINATYYALIAEAMNKVIIDLQDDESTGTRMTEIHMQKCYKFFTKSMQEAKKTVIQEYKSAHREKEIAKVTHNIERIEANLEKKKSESTDGSEDPASYKKLERLLGNLQKKLDSLQSGKSYQASHAGDLASQAGDLASQGGESEYNSDEDEEDRRRVHVKQDSSSQIRNFSVDLWGGKGQRTQARASDLSLKYM